MVPSEKIKSSMKKIRASLHKQGIWLPGWIQLIIWTSGIIVLLVLTIYYSVPIVTNYIDDDANVAIKTEVTLNELLHSTPQLQATVPYYLLKDGKPLAVIAEHLVRGTEDTCRPCQQLKNVSWDVWRGLSFDAEEHKHTLRVLIARFTERMLSELASGTNPFPDEHQDWTWALIEAAMSYFSWKLYLDINHVPNPENGNDKIAAVDAVYLNQTWNGTRVIALLQTRILEALCLTMDLTVTDYENQRTKTCKDILVHGSLPVIMEDESLSFAIPVNDTQRHTIYCVFWRDGQDYESNLFTPPSNWKVPNGVYIIKEPLGLIYWKLDDPNNTLYYPRIGVIQPSRQSFPTLTISYSISTKIKEERTRKKKECSLENNPKTCMLKCSKNWATKYCSCIPYSFRKILNETHAELPYCDETHYSTCNLMAFNDGPRQTCFNNCSKPCNYTGYSYEVYSEAVPSGDKVGFSLWLRPIVDPFVEFSWTTKDRPEDLVSQLGGVIGLYLGATGFSLCVFIISCVDFIQSYRRRKAGKRNAVTNSRAIHLWQMVLMREDQSGKAKESSEEFELHQKVQELMRKERELMRKEIEEIKAELVHQMAHSPLSTRL